MPDRSPTRTWRRAVGAGAATLLVVGLAALPATSAGAPAPAPADEIVTWGDTPPGLSDLDERGTAVPTAAQKTAASLLRGRDVTVRWNDFGTPASVFSPTGDLGPAVGDAPAAARAWLAAHTDLLGVSAAQVAGLDLVGSHKLADSDARAVVFRQRFGGMTPALGSMVTVGVADGRIVYVSSSLTRTTATPEGERAWNADGPSPQVGTRVGTENHPVCEVRRRLTPTWRWDPPRARDPTRMPR